MYIKESRYLTSALDSAIDALSRAQSTARRSEVCNKYDLELASAIYEQSNIIKTIRNEVKEIYG